MSLITTLLTRSLRIASSKNIYRREGLGFSFDSWTITIRRSSGLIPKRDQVHYRSFERFMCHALISTAPHPKATTIIGVITKARSEVLLIVPSCHTPIEILSIFRAGAPNPEDNISLARSKPKWTL
jgi:hypothetical protein